MGNLRAEYADLNGDGHIAENEVLQLIDYHPYGMKRRNTLNHTLKNNYQYNGIDHVDDYGLAWEMATYRSLDGAIGIWNSVDPYAESFYSMSPYCAMGSNPILYNDKEGGFIHIVIGGAIGGVGNLAYQAFTGNIGSIGDGFAAFGIGAAAGAVGAATGGATLAATGAGSTFLGAVGAGALSGAAGGAAGGFIQETGNALYFGEAGLSDALGAGFNGAMYGAASGAVLGGIVGGIGYKGGGNTSPSNTTARNDVFDEFIDSESNWTVTGSGSGKTVGNNAKGYTLDNPNGITIVAKKDIVPYYPTNGGAVGSWKEQTLKVGTRIDRYGTEYGDYFSPAGTPDPMRALPPGNTRTLHTYEVVKPFTVEMSRIAPAFDQVGTGIQYRAPANALTLRELGYLRKVQ